MAFQASRAHRKSVSNSLAPSAVDARPDLIWKDHNYLLAVWRRLVIVVWKGDTTLESVKRVGETIHSSASRVGPVGLFIVTDVTAPLPPAIVRKTAAGILAAAPIAYFCVTFEGNGFRAAAVRGVVTSITMLASMAFPHRAFSKIDEAAVWVSEQTKHDGAMRIHPIGLAAVLDNLRSASNTAI
jgi:hypothetical protein